MYLKRERRAWIFFKQDLEEGSWTPTTKQIFVPNLCVGKVCGPLRKKIFFEGSCIEENDVLRGMDETICRIFEKKTWIRNFIPCEWVQKIYLPIIFLFFAEKIKKATGSVFLLMKGGRKNNSTFWTDDRGPWPLGRGSAFAFCLG